MQRSTNSHATVASAGFTANGSSPSPAKVEGLSQEVVAQQRISKLTAIGCLLADALWQNIRVRRARQSAVDANQAKPRFLANDIEHCRQAGMTAHLAKPVRMEELQQAHSQAAEHRL